MLGRKIKIMTILRQREFITRQLEDTGYAANGNPAYTYIGYIYPENEAYFYSEGWRITEVKCDILTADVEGLPIWLFRPQDDIMLTDEELEKAEQYIELREEYPSEEDSRKNKINFLYQGRNLS